jgi:hypothetical protein
VITYGRVCTCGDKSISIDIIMHNSVQIKLKLQKFSRFAPGLILSFSLSFPFSDFSSVASPSTSTSTSATATSAFSSSANFLTSTSTSVSTSASSDLV